MKDINNIMQQKPRRKVNYINNKHLYTSMIEYRRKLEEAEAAYKDKPQIPNYIGEAIYLICNKLATRGNFSGYTVQWKQEMISDALIDCIAAVDNFNPDKNNNPFGYFGKIAWNAFLRRIEKEKKQTYIKHKNLHRVYDGDTDVFTPHSTQTNDFSDDIIRSFEDKMLEKLTKKKKENIITLKGISVFQEQENE